jgi:uncharacterized protein (DUF2249 family)
MPSGVQAGSMMHATPELRIDRLPQQVAHDVRGRPLDEEVKARRLCMGISHRLFLYTMAVQNPTTEATMAGTTTLDVRNEPPARRHELIFDTFERLSAGHDFELVSDHDPKPLSYQLEAKQTGRFSWEYLEQDPQVWRVRIGRTA